MKIPNSGNKFFSNVGGRRRPKGCLRPPLSIIIACLLTACELTNTQHIAYAEKVTNVTIDNRPVVEITLKLEGKTIPGKPKIVSAENTFDALFEKTSGTPLDLKKTAERTWMCYAIEGQKYVIGWIAKRSWLAKRSKMFGYCSEPFTAREGLTVKFSPGMPATFEYDLTNPPKGVKATPAKVLLLREIIRDGKRTFNSWGGQQEIRRPGILRITGLAAGTYKIFAQTSDIVKYRNSQTPVLYENREVEIKPGSANRFDPLYPEIDTTVEEGDVTIQGILYATNQKPLLNKPVQLIPSNEKGLLFNLYYPVSITDQNGKFKFIGVRPNLSVSIKCDGASTFLGKESLRKNALISMDLVVGSRKLSTEIDTPIQDVFIRWKDGSVGKLSDFAGKIVVLDVWATWCPPCRRSLPKINTLAEEISIKSDVVFIALSVDSDPIIWEETVDKSKWNALRHGWFDRRKNSFVIKKSIPYYIIIDKNGVISCEGNDIDVRLELDKLAKASDQPSTETPEHSTEN